MDGSDYGLRILGAKFHRLGFNCEEGPFWVTLLAVAPGEFLEAERGSELKGWLNSQPSRIGPAFFQFGLTSDTLAAICR